MNLFESNGESFEAGKLTGAVKLPPAIIQLLKNQILFVIRARCVARSQTEISQT